MEEEPSVLDYIKAKLMFWKHSDLSLDALEADNPPQADSVAAGSEDGDGAVHGVSMLEATAAPVERPAQVYVAPEPEPVEDEDPRLPPVTPGFPWMSLAALLLALIAQRTFEPADRHALPGLVFYLLAAALIMLAALRGEWSLPELRPTEQTVDPLSVNGRALFVAIPLALLTILAFKGGVFTATNVMLWAAALIAFGVALRLPDERRRDWRAWLRDLPRRKVWRFSVSRWALVILAVALVVIFFRVTQINAVPSEMVSDQAEKLLDVQDVLNGQYSVFFQRNTGREALQFYLTAAIIKLFHTGISFLSLKIGTITAGLLTLPFIYLLGKEVANRRAGLLAALFAGIAYWPNVISRFGLRFPFYPLFVAPTLYFLVRGLRRSNRNDIIWAGICLGIGLHGYTPIRILPFVVVLAFGLYLIHRQSRGMRRQGIIWLAVLALVSLIVFIPLLVYALQHPDIFAFRAFSRLGSVERPLPGPAGAIFLKNLWNAVTMYFWSDGEIWPISVPYRPALDVVSAALFFCGLVLLLVRYFRKQHWLDLFIILSIPMLMLSSILSLAFPNENPAVNRAGGALVPVFLVIGLALDCFLSVLDRRAPKAGWRSAALAVFLVLFGLSAAQNYDLVFHQYKDNFDAGSWNTTEMGTFIRDFAQSVGTYDSAWVVAYPYWVDTRLVGMNAGNPQRDYAIAIENLPQTSSVPYPKLYIVNLEDRAAEQALRQLYPDGVLYRHTSPRANKDFLFFLTLPPQGEVEGVAP